MKFDIKALDAFPSVPFDGVRLMADKFAPLGRGYVIGEHAGGSVSFGDGDSVSIVERLKKATRMMREGGSKPDTIIMHPSTYDALAKHIDGYEYRLKSYSQLGVTQPGFNGRITLGPSVMSPLAKVTAVSAVTVTAIVAVGWIIDRRNRLAAERAAEAADAGPSWFVVMAGKVMAALAEWARGVLPNKRRRASALTERQDLNRSRSQNPSALTRGSGSPQAGRGLAQPARFGDAIPE